MLADRFMRRVMMMSVVALTTLLLTANAFSQTTATNEHLTTPPEKKIGLGAEVLAVAPLGAYAKYAGSTVGPMFRAGHRPTSSSLEATFRTGFLFGLVKGTGLVDTYGYHHEANVSLLPVWGGVRYFFLGDDPKANVGFYGATELGLNIFLPHGRSMKARFGANAGIGYVISKEMPIDLRAQVSVLNLLEDMPRDSGVERTYVGVGLSAGYTLQL